MESAIAGASKYGEDHLPGPNGSLSIAEIERVFRGLAEAPTRRSAASVLRISYEQLKARRTFSAIPSALWVFAIPLVGVVPMMVFLSPAIRQKILLGLLGWSILGAFAVVYAWRFRHMTARAKADERRIAAMAVDALSSIVAGPVAQEPLDRDQRGQLAKLVRSAPGADRRALQSLGE